MEKEIILSYIKFSVFFQYYFPITEDCLCSLPVQIGQCEVDSLNCKKITESKIYTILKIHYNFHMRFK